jgi:hypothetical protein
MDINQSNIKEEKRTSSNEMKDLRRTSFDIASLNSTMDDNRGTSTKVQLLRIFLELF